MTTIILKRRAHIMTLTRHLIIFLYRTFNFIKLEDNFSNLKQYYVDKLPQIEYLHQIIMKYQKKERKNK